MANLTFDATALVLLLANAWVHLASDHVRLITAFLCFLQRVAFQVALNYNVLPCPRVLRSVKSIRMWQHLCSGICIVFRFITA